MDDPCQHFLGKHMEETSKKSKLLKVKDRTTIQHTRYMASRYPSINSKWALTNFYLGLTTTSNKQIDFMLCQFQETETKKHIIF